MKTKVSFWWVITSAICLGIVFSLLVFENTQPTPTSTPTPSVSKSKSPSVMPTPPLPFEDDESEHEVEDAEED